jgi:hypothetical protein
MRRIDRQPLGGSRAESAITVLVILAPLAIGLTVAGAAAGFVLGSWVPLVALAAVSLTLLRTRRPSRRKLLTWQQVDLALERELRRGLRRRRWRRRLGLLAQAAGPAGMAMDETTRT